MRLTPGTTWVSHLLQRLTHALVTDAATAASIERAGAHYAARNASFVALLRENGLDAEAGDGLNLWLRLPVPARAVSEQLMRRGWLARPGDEFVLAGDESSYRLRLTVHDLDDPAAAQLAADLAAAVTAAGGRARLREVG